MDDETIAKLGFEAGAESVGFFTLKKFAELVASHEREACAQICEKFAPTTTPTWVSYAAQIRARGNNA
jgi:hypothetical protein